ncbi:MAG: MMPL family transporter [Chloroflexi bacterium]|nr:MMPL family transporter [Chloroflexota bacterium]
MTAASPRPPHHTDPFFRLGHWIHRRRWLVLAAWAVLVLATLPLAPTAASRLAPGGFSTARLEAQRATSEIQAALGENPSTLLVIFTHPTLATTDPAYLDAVDTALAELRTLPLVARVTTHRDNPRQAAPDGHTAYAVIALRSLPDQFRGVIPQINGALRPTELTTTLTGAPVFFSDIQSVTERDLRRAEFISFPFAGLALILVFGSLVAAAIPAVIGGTAVIATLGAVVVITRFTDISIFAMSLVSMLGLGLGIDYSLFVVSRFRDELARHDVPDALGIAMATAGKAVLFSGLTVFIGLLGLTMFTFNALRSLGIAGSVVVALSVVAALTLLPAILAVVGRKVDALSVIRPAQEKTGFWHAVAARVMRRSGLIFLVVMALLTALGAPFLHVKFGAPDASILPADVQSRQGFDQLRRAFGEGEISPILISVQAPESIYAPDRLVALDEFVSRIKADPRVERVDSIMALDPRLTRDQHLLIFRDPARIYEPYARALAADTTRERFTLVRVVSKGSQTSDLSKSLVKAIRNTPVGGDLSFKVAGGTAGVIDYSEGLYSELPRALLFIVAATYFVLLLLFRSVILPIKALIMNTLSILASYGALVVVFQDGALAGLLGFQPLGFIEASLPIVMFCVLFGLSMDYEVFLLSRVKEAYDGGLDNSQSVAVGLEQSGRLITSAAAIVVLVSSSFIAADIILIKALGLGTAIAVFLDATVVRGLLVPATMQLLGDWNWWAPRAVLRLLPARLGGAA